METIDTKRLNHPAVKDYLINADRRIAAGARFVLEALNLACPDYLTRKPAGRPLAKRIMADFRKDHPETLHQATLRKAGIATDIFG
jgi:hypothetical protein